MGFVSAVAQHLDTLSWSKTDQKRHLIYKNTLSLLSYRQGPSGVLCQLNQTACGLLSQTFFLRLNTAVHYMLCMYYYSFVKINNK